MQILFRLFKFVQVADFPNNMKRNKNATAKLNPACRNTKTKYSRFKWKNVNLIDEPPAKVVQHIIFRETNASFILCKSCNFSFQRLYEKFP